MKSVAWVLGVVLTVVSVVGNFGCAADQESPLVLATREYGRKPYREVRDSILYFARGTADGKGIRAAARVFEMAGDKDSFVALLTAMDTNLLVSPYVRRVLESVASQFGRDVWCDFVLRVPCHAWKISQPGEIHSQQGTEGPLSFVIFETGLVDRLQKGTATEKEQNVLLLGAELNPRLFARLAPRLSLVPDDDVFAFCVRKMDEAKKCGKEETFKTWHRRASCSIKSRTMDESVRQFLSLLDLTDVANLWESVGILSECGKHGEAADQLASSFRDDIPVSNWEKAYIQSSRSIYLTDDRLKEMALERRRTSLLSELLAANRPVEAQKWAETFYGPGADPSKHVDVPWRLLGTTQVASGGTTFKSIVDGQSPKEKSSPSTLDRYHYYCGRNERGKAETILREGIKACQAEANRTAECIRLLETLSGHLRHDKRDAEAMDVLRQAYETGFAVLAACGNEVVDVQNAHCSVFYSLVCKLRERGLNEEWDALFRREFKSGRLGYLGYYQAWKGGLVLEADDPLFRILLSEERQRREGFAAEGHAMRIKLVADAVVAKCIDEMVADAVRYCDDPATGIRSVTIYLGNRLAPNNRVGLVGARLFETFGDRIDPSAEWNLWKTAAPHRTFGRLKAELERAWARGSLSLEYRLEGLRILREKAETDADRVWCDAELAKFSQ